MSDYVSMQDIQIKTRARAIICFGPATPITGMKTAEYYQVIIDPDMVSPGGDYIRFDARTEGNEVHGWQRIAALTICEILDEGPPNELGKEVIMRAIVKD